VGRPRVVEYSKFGEFLLLLCDRSNQSVFEVGLKAGLGSKSRINYAMRPYSGKGRTGRLSEEELRRLANAVHASQDERRLLVLYGLKEHLPPLLKRYVESIEKDNRRLRRGRGEPEHFFDLGG
jgi:hypothetical protein